MRWIRFLKEWNKTDWILAGAGIVFILIQIEMDLNLPSYMSRITLLLQKPGTTLHALLQTGGVMLLFALASLLASCAAAVCVSALSYAVGGTLRSRLFHQVMTFSMGETDTFSPASLITRSTNDITQVQTFMVMGLQVIVKAPLTAIGAIHKVSGMVWQWTAVTIIGTILIVAFVSTCVALILPKQKMAQTLTDDMNQIADANLTGIAVIHAYNAEKTAEDKFSDANEKMTKNSLFSIRAMALLSPAVQLILNGMTLAIYWVGAVLISETGTIYQAGLFANMLAFAQYAVQIVNAFVMLTMIFTMIPRAMVSFRRIDEVIETVPSVKDNGTITTSSKTGTVAFRHVDFCYPGEVRPTIQDITFSAEKGETVAIIGSTGSGKSTVINLIPRLYEVSKGEILVDDINIKDYTLHALRNKIGYCSQQAMLLSGTVGENICYGAKANKESVTLAMHTAQIDSFVQQMDDGMHTAILQDGSNVSGGQKQRISIARALEKSPEILILDDSTSALDYDTEKHVYEELQQNYPDMTKIVITQRINSIRNVDHIIVMDEGRIVGQGTHAELLKNCAVYQQIAKTQGKEAAI